MVKISKNDCQHISIIDILFVLKSATLTGAQCDEVDLVICHHDNVAGQRAPQRSAALARQHVVTATPLPFSELERAVDNQSVATLCPRTSGNLMANKQPGSKRE